MAISLKAALENLSDMPGERPNNVHLQGKSIPFDVIEAILSKLPVKSLIRFQLLSKSWKAIIVSDPWFAKINYNHLSKTPNLFLHGNLKEEPYFSLVRLEDTWDLLHTVAELGAPFGPGALLSSCNGIALLVPDNDHPCGGRFVLWNPSIRRYATISIPGTPELRWFYAELYQDSRANDYKIAVVVSGERRSMVYSCKTRTWAEEELIPWIGPSAGGVFVDGCFYWLKDGDGDDDSFEEILCFDFRERKTEKSKLPEKMMQDGVLKLYRLRGRLCLCRQKYLEMQIWVRENDGWREVTNIPRKCFRGLCLDCYHWQEFGHDSDFQVYNSREVRLEEFDVLNCHDLMPHSESLFFPFDSFIDFASI